MYQKKVKEMEKIIYCDHSATTFVKEEVMQEMLPYFSKNYGNASSLYSIGRASKAAIEKARNQVATCLHSKAEEIYFTAGGSEADNMIIAGIARANKEKGKHIITTKIEHKAVLNTCQMLENEGFEITYLNVDKKGIVNIYDLEKAIRKDTILVSIMFVNNELGTIQPIEKIGKMTKFKNVYFHTDAVQAIGNIPIDVKALNIDALSLSAHKFYGPKGVGVAYIQEKIAFLPYIYGGHQEFSKRAGTENVAGIVGLGKAIELAYDNCDAHNEKLKKLRHLFISRLTEEIEDIQINGDLEKRVSGNINVTFKGIDCENLLVLLDMNGICVSAGSACNSSSMTPSHVLTAIGLSKAQANSTVRFTFGDENTEEDVYYMVDVVKKSVEKLRRKCECL